MSTMSSARAKKAKGLSDGTCATASKSVIKGSLRRVERLVILRRLRIVAATDQSTPMEYSYSGQRDIANVQLGSMRALQRVRAKLPIVLNVRIS